MNLRTNSFNLSKNNYKTKNQNNKVNFGAVIKTEVVFRPGGLKPDLKLIGFDKMDVINEFIRNVLILGSKDHPKGEAIRKGFKAIDSNYQMPLKPFEEGERPVLKMSITSSYDNFTKGNELAILTGDDFISNLEDSRKIWQEIVDRKDIPDKDFPTFVGQKLQNLHEKFYAKADPNKKITIYAKKIPNGAEITDVKFDIGSNTKNTFNASS